MEHPDSEEPPEPAEYNEFSLTCRSAGSEVEYDDELGVPESLKIVDIGDGPVVIEHSDDEVTGKSTSSMIKSMIK